MSANDTDAVETRTDFLIVYSSSATSAFEDEELGSLLAQSRSANERVGITGMLLCRRGRFIQFLEGDETAVRDLMAVIASDERHTDVRVLLEDRPSFRQFPDWTMGYEPIADVSDPPRGFRSTFADLESDTDDADHDSVLRAARELTLWFRVRAGSH